MLFIRLSSVSNFIMLLLTVAGTSSAVNTTTEASGTSLAISSILYTEENLNTTMPTTEASNKSLVISDTLYNKEKLNIAMSTTEASKSFLTIDDILDIKEKPPPVVKVAEGHDLKLLLKFAPKSISAFNKDLVFSMHKGPKHQSLYRCKNKKFGYKGRNLDCYCSGCQGDHKHTRNGKRLRSERKKYQIQKGKVTKLDMVFHKLEKSDNGTVYTLEMENKIVYRTEVRVSTEPCPRLKSKKEQHNRKGMLSPGVIAGIIFAIVFVIGVPVCVFMVYAMNKNKGPQQGANPHLRPYYKPSQTHSLPPNYQDSNHQYGYSHHSIPQKHS